MDLAEIWPDLKNLAGKCYRARSIRVSSGFGEKIRDRTDQIGFWRRKPATDRRSSRVGRWSVWVQLDLPGGSGHRLSWTPLVKTQNLHLKIAIVIISPKCTNQMGT